MQVNLTNFRNKSSLTLFSGRVKAVSMSKDGKKFSFSSNFDSPEGVSKFAKSEVVKDFLTDAKFHEIDKQVFTQECLCLSQRLGMYLHFEQVSTKKQFGGLRQLTTLPPQT